MGVVAGVDPIEHPLGVAADDRERGAQLVRHVGEQGTKIVMSGPVTFSNNSSMIIQTLGRAR